MPQLPTEDLLGVQLVSAGGPYLGIGSPKAGSHVTVADLESAAASFQALRGRVNAPVKLGHNDGQAILKDAGFVGSDGKPAAGWLDNLRVVGSTLLADLRNVPAKVAALIHAGAYRARSIEFWRNWTDTETGTVHPFVVNGLALLGADQPAVKSLDDIVNLYAEGSADGLESFVMTDAFATPGDWLPLADADREWVESDVVARLHELAGVTEGVEATEAHASLLRTAYLYWDGSAPQDISKFRYPVADVIDGELVAVPAAIFNAATLIETDVAVDDADRETIRWSIGAYYGRLGRIPPWGGMTNPMPSDYYRSKQTAPTTEENEAEMPMLDALRKQLGLSDDADETAIAARVSELTATETQAKDVATQLADATAKLSETEGKFVSREEFTAMQAKAEAGVTAQHTLFLRDRDDAIKTAIDTGRITPAQVEKWQAAYERDAAGTLELLSDLVPNGELLREIGSESKDEATVASEKAIEELHYEELMSGLSGGSSSVFLGATA